MNHDDILQRLRDGNARFVSDQTVGDLRDGARRAALTGGQSPFAIVLSCADSRVIPEIAFDTGLGELFVIRVAGNVANSSSLGSIEYAVAHLATSVIVVLGHESCGAVTAALAGGDNGYNINHLLAHIAPAATASEDKSVNAVVKKNAQLVAETLSERSGIVRGALESGALKVVPAYYELGSGKVEFL